MIKLLSKEFQHIGKSFFWCFGHGMTLSSADLWWNESISIICKLNQQDLSAENIECLFYHERCQFLPDKAENPELRGLVTFYQLQIHSKTCRKYKNEACKLNFGKCFTIQTITTEPLPEDLPLEVKILVLEKQKDILMKVKDYINNCLNPSKIKLFNHSHD